MFGVTEREACQTWCAMYSTPVMGGRGEFRGDAIVYEDSPRSLVITYHHGG